MQTKTDVKPVENFWQNDQRPEFLLIWGPKWPKNWTSEAHILHTSKSTCNEHVKQYWCGTSEIISRKWPKTSISTYFGAPNGPQNWASQAHIPHTTKSTCNELVKQCWCETSEKFLRKWPKSRIMTSTLGSKIGKKMGLWGPYCAHLWKSSKEHI